MIIRLGSMLYFFINNLIKRIASATELAFHPLRFCGTKTNPGNARAGKAVLLGSIEPAKFRALRCTPPPFRSGNSLFNKRLSGLVGADGEFVFAFQSLSPW